MVISKSKGNRKRRVVNQRPSARGNKKATPTQHRQRFEQLLDDAIYGVKSK